MASDIFISAVGLPSVVVWVAAGAAYVASGATLLALAFLIGVRAKDGPGRLLAWFLGVDAVHWLAHAAPYVTTSPILGQAWLNTFHIPSFFGFVIGVLFVSSFTGIHRAFWWHPAAIAGLLVVPAAMLVTELLTPAPFWVYSQSGAHLVDGPLSQWSHLYGAIHLAFDVYFVAVLAAGLRRRAEPQVVPAHALLLAFFIIRVASVQAEFATNPARWDFLGLVGVGEPALLSDALPVVVVLTALAAAWPLPIVCRGATEPVCHAGIAAVALAVLVATGVALGAGDSVALMQVRFLYAGLILFYAALRHGAFGARRVGPKALELPLAVAGFALAVTLFDATLSRHLPEALAIPIGLGLALVCTALMLSVSGVATLGPLRPATDVGFQPLLGGPGDLVGGRYRLEALLQAGPGGETHRALDRRARSRVVLKLLPHRAAEQGFAAREAQALQGLDPRYVVPLRDVVASDQGLVLVFDEVPGGTLAARLEHGPLSSAEWRTFARDLFAAVESVHDADVVHRDIKPANILLDARGAPRLADFDIARIPDSDQTLTTGSDRRMPLGTLRYMAPEQARGDVASAASDRYSLAATLYEAATGVPYVERRPNESQDELWRRVVHLGPFDPKRSPDPALAAWFSQALAPDPEDRFDTLDAMRASLRQALARSAPATVDASPAGPGFGAGQANGTAVW